MKLIVGLGNPDIEYQNTFHNLGFMGVDNAAEKFGATFAKQKCKALIAEYGIGKDKVIFAKPLTYMNLSGESIRELISFYKIELKDLLVIFDDYDLPKGNIRIRENGSAGTHNGMRNIIKELGNGDFMRIRVGFKQDGDFKIPLINYVLSKISEADKPLFDKALNAVGEAVKDFVSGKDVQYLMQKYNGKPN